MSFQTGSLVECLYNNKADFTANVSFTSEVTMLTGPNEQPMFPAGFFLQPPYRRRFRIHASGILGSTATPTYTFTVRLNTTAGVANIAGAILLKSAALTTASGISTKIFVIDGWATVYTPGIGSGNTTITAGGTVSSPGGLASPFTYALTPSAGESATWTQTYDGSVTHWLNLSVTCSASDAGNTITLKELAVYGEN